MKKIGELLKSYMDSLDIESMPYFVFKNALDDKFKDKVEFVEIKNSILVAKVVHPSYKQLFQMQEISFLKKIQTLLPTYDIKRIKYRN